MAHRHIQNLICFLKHFLGPQNPPPPPPPQKKPPNNQQYFKYANQAEQSALAGGGVCLMTVCGRLSVPPSVSALGCCTKIPDGGAGKGQKFISLFWRLFVWNQGAKHQAGSLESLF